MATPHINAEKGDFAKTVLMPGDPLRAKYIAENFLSEVKEVNSVRGMLGYTGRYGEKTVSVMGSGMGMPSMGIYSHELYTEFEVENIIRIGSCGAYTDKLRVKDIVLAQAACTNSNYACQYDLQGGVFAPIADFELLSRAKAKADEMGLACKVGNVLSSDVFYEPEGFWKKWAALGVLGVEMETAALYMNAAKLGKRALCVLTVSDHFITKDDDLTSAERERSLNDMIMLALEVAE